jgi:hypothetical protein
MEINSFSKIDRVGRAISSMFKFIFGWILKIDIITIFLMLGALGWMFGMYMDFYSTIKIFGFVLVGTLVITLFVVDSRDDLGILFGFCFVLSGIAGFWFEGNIQTVTNTNTTKEYMVNPVISGKSIEYIGSDEMTKIITLSDAEILAHYKKFKNSSRFTYMYNTSITKNVILDFVGVDYIVSKREWITLYDLKAKKNLFQIK